jgi:hypothetical protein
LVSLVSAGSVASLGAVRTDGALVLVYCGLGVGGAAFTVVAVAAPDPGPTVQALAVRLNADTVLRLGYDRVDGVRLRTLTERASPVPG